MTPRERGAPQSEVIGAVLLEDSPSVLRGQGYSRERAAVGGRGARREQHGRQSRREAGGWGSQQGAGAEEAGAEEGGQGSPCFVGSPPRERVVPQSEVIRGILLEDSPLFAGPLTRLTLSLHHY